MNDVLILFKVQLLGFFGVNTARKTKDPSKKKKARGFLATALISVLAFAYLSTQYSIILAMSLKEYGELRMMPQLIVTASTLLLLIMTIYKASSVIFGSKDNEILMALPVSTGKIIASRVLVLYVMNSLYSFCLLVPMGIVYAINAPISWSYYPILLLLIFVMPVIPIVIACILGAFASYIATFFKSTGFFQTAIQLTLFLAVMAFSFSMQNYNSQAIMNIGNSTAGTVDKIYPFISLFVKALCDSDLVSLLILVAASAALFAIFCALLALRYKKINSALSARRTRSDYKLEALDSASPFKALLRKELKKFFSSTNYLMNAGIGAVMMILAAVSVIFFSSKLGLDALFDSEKGMKIVTAVMPFIFGSFICMTCPAASSISLEGKSLWAIKVLPVSAKTILMAKATVNLIVTIVPTVISAVLMLIKFDFSPFRAVMLFAVSLTYCFLSSFSSLLANLKYPVFDWKNEIVPIKQSTASFISILGFMPLSILPAFAVGMLSDFYVPVVLALTALLAGICIAEYKYICGKKAETAFAMLG